MTIILLSGGSGKRLWPLSNDIRSKQFLGFFKTADGYESMLQRVYRQIREVDSRPDIVIAVAKTQVSLIRGQLGDSLSICAEPCRRDTFPAISLATAYLHDVKGMKTEEPVVVCPVDPYADETYFETMLQLGNMVKDGDENLFLMGITPTYPSDKYGYIIPENHEKISRVLEFKEKPKIMMAKKYIAKGGLWNSGVFAYRASYVLEKAEEILGYGTYDGLLKNYNSLAKISFDYAVVEQESKISVLCYEGKWRDVGAWDTLTEELDATVIGRGRINDCRNVHLLNELDIPIVAIGLGDIVIAASEEGILVADKGKCSQIKSLVDESIIDMGTKYRF